MSLGDIVCRRRYRVRNWAEDNRGVARRYDIRLWQSDEAIVGWRAECRKTPGGQRRFSNLAVETTLVLGALCRFPIRQTEGFMRSLVKLMKVNLTVPDHTTLALILLDLLDDAKPFERST